MMPAKGIKRKSHPDLTVHIRRPFPRTMIEPDQGPLPKISQISAITGHQIYKHKPISQKTPDYPHQQYYYEQ
jgi:hypothetical protein